MALTVEVLKSQLNITGAGDDALLSRLLSASIYHVESELGFELTDTDALPDGIPGDLEHAVLMTAAHWYENREATLVGVSAAALPIGVPEIIANKRRYTFAADDD